jgi:DNA end-binding protein Ku
MARALWKGTISFGLVTIPVELHTAVRAARPKFRLLHAKDLSPIEYRKVCSRDGKPVSWDDR